MSGWTDEQMLEALHLRDHEGLTMAAIGKRVGQPRNAVIGMLGRINAAADKADPHGVQDGTMPPRWWRR